MGYYSRVRNLQRAAQRVVADFGGVIPADVAALRSLPGVGRYTAGAVASIAYDIPAPAVDGNVLRVLARPTDDDTDVMLPAAKTAAEAALAPCILAGRGRFYAEPRSSWVRWSACRESRGVTFARWHCSAVPARQDIRAICPSGVRQRRAGSSGVSC